MSAPIKKRAISAALKEDSDSEPSFQSPGPPTDDEDEDDEDFSMGNDGEGAGACFEAPVLDDSQGTLNESSPFLLTQPKMCSVTKSRSAGRTKRRKVSLSPQNEALSKTETDDIQQSRRRKSPRSATRAAVDSGKVDETFGEDTPKGEQYEYYSAPDSEVTMVEVVPEVSLHFSDVGKKSDKSAPSAAKLPTSLSKNLFPESVEKLANEGLVANAASSDVKSPKQEIQGTKRKVSRKRSVLETLGDTPNQPASSEAIDKKEAATQKPKAAQASTNEPSSAVTTTKVASSSKAVKSTTKSGPKVSRKTTTTKKNPPESTTSTTDTGATLKDTMKPPQVSVALLKKAEVGMSTPSTSVSEGSKDTKPAPSTTTKKKKKKLSFQDSLVKKMFMTSRPYTVKLLADELKASTSAIEFCFLSLVDKGWIIKKEFSSKSRNKELYWANQDCQNKELLDILDLVPAYEISKSKQELQDLQEQSVALSRELSTARKELSNQALDEELQSLEATVQSLEKQLGDTRTRIRDAKTKGSAAGKPKFGIGKMTGQTSRKPLSSDQLKKKINAMRLQWKKRKEKCMDFIDQLADGMEKKVKDVINLLELETDEFVGVKMPQKYDV